MENSNPDGNLPECPVPVLTKTQRSPETFLELVRLGVGVSCLFGRFGVLCLLIFCILKWLWLPGAFSARCWCHICQGWAVGLWVLRMWGRESLTSECTHWPSLFAPWLWKDKLSIFSSNTFPRLKKWGQWNPGMGSCHEGKLPRQNQYKSKWFIRRVSLPIFVFILLIFSWTFLVKASFQQL